MRITRKVFTDLTIFMIGFGLVIGIVFPLFVNFIGVPKSYTHTPLFITLCILAGIIVGGINILLTRLIVGKRLALLSERMIFVKNKLDSGLTSTELSDCSHEQCIIPVDSDDVIGTSAQAFNDLVLTLSNSMRSENAVKSFNEMLSSKLELNQLADLALQKTMEFMNANAGAILIEKAGELFIASSKNIRTPEKLISDDSIWMALNNKEGVKLSLPAGIKIESPLVSFIPLETLIEPLIYKNVSIGAVMISSSKAFHSEDMYGFEMFIRGMALALRNAVMYEQLQKLAANDPLTGLYNRRFGMIRLSEEFSRSVRNNLPLGIIMFDIDHFKSFNDTYGHTLGDKVLVTITKVATKAVREGDFIIRYGGEEFLVILPGASINDTEFVAERVRHMIDDCKVPHQNQELHVTVSAGCSSLMEQETSSESVLIDFADKALYSAKQTGRNKVVTFKG